MELSADECLATQSAAKARKQLSTDKTLDCQASEPVDELRSVAAQDSQTTCASSSRSEQGNDQVSDQTLEWIPGQPWHWGVFLRCHFCHVVRPVKEFGKKSQTYSCRERRCLNC